MLSVNLKSTSDILIEIAKRVKAARLHENLSQMGLAQRSGVSLGSLKRFESGGQISLESLIKISFALNLQGDFDKLFISDNLPKSLDELLVQTKHRMRGTVK